MAYAVNLTARATRNLRSIYRFIQAEDSATAATWFDGLEQAILNLDRHPRRGQQIPEHPNLRQILYGNKPHIYRILYIIDETSQTVYIVHIRHGARDAIK